MLVPVPGRRSLSLALAGGGRLLLVCLALGLILSGLFAWAVSGTGRFLPHDERFLGMTSRDLCALHGCRIVHFMIHDRVSFGGALVAVGVVYLWLVLVPLRQGQAWAWWLLLVSGAVGFASFFAYLGYGYLDRWHALATLTLLPCFLLGLVHSHPALPPGGGLRCLLVPGVQVPWRSVEGIGRGCLLGTAAALVVGGLLVLAVGMSCVFVPQDLAYLGVSPEELRALNPRLVPLIAHDRAGFGGAVCCCGVALFFCVWCGRLTRSLWWVLALAGLAGFGAAIGVHPLIGYNDPIHLAPAVAGAALYLLGLLLTARPRADAPVG